MCRGSELLIWYGESYGRKLGLSHDVIAELEKISNEQENAVAEDTNCFESSIILSYDRKKKCLTQKASLK